MEEIILTLIKWAVIIGIFAIVAVVAVKLLVAIFPVLLVVGGIFLVGWFFSNSDSKSVPPPPKKTEIQRQVKATTHQIRNSAQQKLHEEVESLAHQKSGVNLSTLRPELDSAILVVVAAYREIMEDDNFMPVITSGNDFEGHAVRSAHYSGAAVDFRIKDIGDVKTRKALAELVAEDLDSRFLVLHEDIGRANEHLHVQLKNGTYDRNVVWR